MVSIKGLREELEQFFLPQLNEIKGEIKALDTKIDSVRAEISSVRREMDIRFTALSEKLEIIKDVEQIKSRLTQLEARH
ncbi:MAG: hypothetical protein KGH81_07585 [Thaumarchaeota archaeon]|nr:hypothetical protein [Nitrososphaerota archaeon]MDE1841969.1 hypothetical protein [Nitrososphaerota archaeon]